MLEVVDLGKNYGRTAALASVSFSLPPGICIVAGPNGAGKTTLLRTLTGAERPSAGTITLDGVDVLSDPWKARRHISYLSDAVPLYGDLSVEDHLIYRGRLKGLSSKRLRARIRHVTELLDLKPVYTRYTSLLSAGQRKRVGIADALLSDSRLLAIDEPYDGLDPVHCEMLTKALESLSRHTVIMLATHRLDAVEKTKSTCLVLASGRLAAKIDVATRPEGTTLTEAVANSVAAFYTSTPEALA